MTSYASLPQGFNPESKDSSGFPDSSVGKESTCNAGDPSSIPGDRLPTPVFLGFPCGSAGKESACNAGDLGSTPGLERSPGEGKVYIYPLQYSGIENSVDYNSPWGHEESDTTEQHSHRPLRIHHWSSKFPKVFLKHGADLMIICVF